MSVFSIPPPNFTQTPNIFFDEIMLHLNEGELKVFLFIMRQTFGWHKLEDWITTSLMAKKTGYDRRSICRIINRLLQKKLIRKRIEGAIGYQKCYYSLVTTEGEREQPDPDDGIETEEDAEYFKESYTPDPVVGAIEIKKSYTPDRESPPPPDRESHPPPDRDVTHKRNSLTKETIQNNNPYPFGAGDA